MNVKEKENIVQDIGQILRLNYCYDSMEDVGYASNGNILLMIKFYNNYYRVFDFNTRTAGFLQIAYDTLGETLREKLHSFKATNPITRLNAQNVEESRLFSALAAQRSFDFCLHEGVGFLLTWKENSTFNFLIRLLADGELIILTLQSYGYQPMTAEQKEIVENALTDIVCPEE